MLSAVAARKQRAPDREEAPSIVHSSLQEPLVKKRKLDLPSLSGYQKSDHIHAVPVTRGFSPSSPVNVVRTNPLDEENLHIHHRFVPKREENVFQLSAEETARLPFYHKNARSALLVLRPGESLIFFGTAHILILVGQVCLMGVDLAPSSFPHLVFAPSSHPIPSMTGSNKPSEPCEDVENIPRRVRERLSASSIVVGVQQTRNGIESLSRISRMFRGIFPDSEASSDVGFSGFQILTDLLPERSHIFRMEMTWKRALEPAISWAQHAVQDPHVPPFIALVRGPKGSGKSTFSRTLLNTIVTRYPKVAYLECDLGQSEFTPGGMLSLHLCTRTFFGPPFSHPASPLMAHFIGANTPRSNPSHYLACIEALLETYRLEVRHTVDEVDGDPIVVPLIINTHGWAKGLGADLVTKIQAMAEPTHVYSFRQSLEQSSEQESTPTSEPSNTHDGSEGTYYLLPVPSPMPTTYTASDLRGLSLMSYFHSSSHTPNGDSTTWSTVSSLPAFVPWEIDSTVAFNRIVLLGPGSESVTPMELSNALHVGIVGLILDENATTSSGKTRTTDAPYEQGAPPPSPAHSRCVGLGLVRYVSKDSQVLHLITPVPGDILAQCRVIVKGEMELPIWGMLEYMDELDEPNDLFGVEWGRVPYLQQGSSARGVGSAKRRIRRNILRHGQI